MSQTKTRSGLRPLQVLIYTDYSVEQLHKELLSDDSFLFFVRDNNIHLKTFLIESIPSLNQAMFLHEKLKRVASLALDLWQEGRTNEIDEVEEDEKISYVYTKKACQNQALAFLIYSIL
jgi:hypothetical protein